MHKINNEISKKKFLIKNNLNRQNKSEMSQNMYDTISLHIKSTLFVPEYSSD